MPDNIELDDQKTHELLQSFFSEIFLRKSSREDSILIIFPNDGNKHTRLKKSFFSNTLHFDVDNFLFHGDINPFPTAFAMKFDGKPDLNATNIMLLVTLYNLLIARMNAMKE